MLTRSTNSSTPSPVLDLPEGRQRDVVEVLLDAHIEARQMVSMAECLASGSATCASKETATTIADHVEWLLPMHWDDEERSLAPRLLGRHRVVDDALSKMKLQHVALEAPLARLKLICTTLSRDISRLHALRFELAAAAKDLKDRLAEHHALEESIVFPARKRLLYVDELESIQREMRERRVAAAA